MKVAFIFAAALILCVALLGPIQARFEKPKYCVGKNGKHYLRGEHYDDKVKGTCIRYTCVRKGKKLKMSKKKVPCAVESEPDLVSNVTAIEASMKFINGSMESMENKMEALQSNVESLQSSVESLQISVESILGMITAMQSTSSRLESCLGDITSSACPPPPSGKTSMSGGISGNTAALADKCDASTCSDIQTTVGSLETCLGDVNSTDCPSSQDGKISVVDAIKGNKEDIEALEKPNFNLVLTGGYSTDVGNLATSEIISPGGVCSQSIPPLPVAVYGTQSVYIRNTLLVCGGHRSRYRKRCQQLRDSNSHWTGGPAMNKEKMSFSLTKVGQDLYALGGSNAEGYLDSMEKLSESSDEWTIMEQKLTSPRSSHCTVFMETTRSLVIIGGSPSTNLVEEFNMATSTWKELAPLPVALNGHGCIQLGQTIVVTGGQNGNARQKKVYTFTGGQWQTTGELQMARHGHSMGILDNKLLVLGGRDVGNDYVDTIEEMKEDGSFRTMEWRLKGIRGYSAITQIPREMFLC